MSTTRGKKIVQSSPRISLICLFGLEEIGDRRGFTGVGSLSGDCWIEVRGHSDLSEGIGTRWEWFRLTVPFSVLIM